MCPASFWIHQSPVTRSVPPESIGLHISHFPTSREAGNETLHTSATCLLRCCRSVAGHSYPDFKFALFPDRGARTGPPAGLPALATGGFVFHRRKLSPMSALWWAAGPAPPPPPGGGGGGGGVWGAAGPPHSPPPSLFRRTPVFQVSQSSGSRCS